MSEVPLYCRVLGLSADSPCAVLRARVARWSTRVSFPLNVRVLRDQICTSFGLKVDRVEQVDC